MVDVSLTPELERFAEECVATGAYSSVSEVAQAALMLLRDGDAVRASFLASLEAANAEGERDGFSSVAEVEAALRDESGAGRF